MELLQNVHITATQTDPNPSMTDFLKIVNDIYIIISNRAALLFFTSPALSRF